MRSLPFLLAAALTLTACGGFNDPTPAQQPGGPNAAATPANPEDARDAEFSRILRELKAAENAGDEEKVADLEQQLRDTDAEEEAELEEEFAQTPFDKVIDRLPLDRPPLYVGQFMTEDEGHRLIVRPPARRFFCGRTLDQRLDAVRKYYEDADRHMRKAGIRDFELVVDSLRDTGEVRALARAKDGEVRLTKRGSGPGPC